MRILVVSHRYPPAHTAGTEVYSAQLAAGMAARGHAVHVLCAEKDLARRDLTLSERSHEGLPVTELVNNLFHAELAETWRRPAIDALFGQVLDRERPDLVHLMHLMYLSTGCVDEARRRGIPVVFTLHDFWLACPRFGQLRHPEGTLCETIDFARCGGCMVDFKHAQSPLERTTGKAIASLRAATGLDLSDAARSAARRLARPRPAAVWSAPDPSAAQAMAGQVEARRDHMQAELAPGVSHFIAPSRFLGQRMLSWGLPSERLTVITTGIDRTRYAARARPAGSGAAPLRVLFLGTYAEHKGAHVLLAAWEKLAPELRARARLDLHGPPSPDLPYIERLERAASGCGAHMHGPMPRAEIAAAMASADLVVVPSIWYENAPMVILEALAVRTPLLVSGLGGMAELVQPGVSGRHFLTGDASDLAARLTEMLVDPAALARLYPPTSRERTFEDTLDDVEGVYARVRAGDQP